MATSRGAGWVVAAAMAGAVVALAVVDATNQAPLPAGFVRAVNAAPGSLRALPPGPFFSAPGALRALAPAGPARIFVSGPGSQAGVSIAPGPPRFYIKGPPAGSGQVQIVPPPAMGQILTPGPNIQVPFPGPLGLGVPGTFAQSGEAVYGTVASTGSSSFTVKLHGGQTVTVDKTSATKYLGSPSTLKNGETVVVVGSPKGTAIDATQVVVLPAGGTKVSWTIAR